MIKHRPWLTALLILIAPASIAETSFPEKSVFKERVPNVLQETPYYQPAVDNGTLEPIEQRIPLSPYIDNGSHNPQAQSGGQINILMSKSKDVRRMVTYGYARLVGFTEKLTLAADILESYEVAEGRIFTFTLRAGHRWSDGHPFTTDDFRYYWEDVANNKDISSFGPPKALLVNGQKPTVEYINATTIRYSWAQPNPNFLLALAGARPLFLYRPAHYLKQFHSRYADPKQLAEKVGNAKLKYKSWAGLHQRRDHLYKFDNIELPTLQPWLPTTQKPSERFIFVRNPYYHRLDTQGRQLPYIDKFIINIASGKLISAKASAGESDLQGRYIQLSNYTFLKEGEARNNYTTRLWKTSQGSRITLYPNLNANDEGWRKLFREVRFRRALSLAVNRHEINQAIYFGLALSGADTLLPEAPLYQQGLRQRWAQYDITQANQLLDEIGLHHRNKKGLRLMPDGRPLEITIQTAGESTEETDVLELIHDSWLKIGIKLYSKPSEREVFRNRVFSGEALMSVWTGIPNAIASSAMNPAQLAPTSQQQLQWPKWGKHFETGQESPPDLPDVQRLLQLNTQWGNALTEQDRAAAWEEMLHIRAEGVFSIGTVSGVLQPIVVNNKLRNVPEKGLWNWEPNGFFGVYRPDRFWLDRSPEKSAPNNSNGDR